MYNLNDMINEIVKLRGDNVRIFGQPRTLNTEPTEQDILIDTVDLLEEFKGYELDIWAYEMDINGHNYEEDENAESVEFETVEQFLNYMIDEGMIIDDYKGDNSYNYSGYLNHDIDFRIYKLDYSNQVWVELKTHRYGDVRGNYTESVLLEFGDEWEFLEVLHTPKFIELEINDDLFQLTVYPMNEEVSVYQDSTGYEFYIYPCDIEEAEQLIIDEVEENE